MAVPREYHLPCLKLTDTAIKKRSTHPLQCPNFHLFPFSVWRKGYRNALRKQVKSQLFYQQHVFSKRKALENLIPCLSWKDLLVIPHVRTSILGSRLLQSICSTKHHFYTSLKVHHCLVSLDFVQVIEQINEHTYSTWPKLHEKVQVFHNLHLFPVTLPHAV